MAGDSQDYFKRSLEKKISDANETVGECIRQFLSPVQSERRSSAKKAEEAVHGLVEILAPKDRPKWLLDLYSCLQRASNGFNNPSGASAVHRIALELHPQQQSFDWKVDGPGAGVGIDFDSIYNKCRSEGRVEELFKKIVSILEEIIESNEIDSRQALRELERVIATLKAAERGSYFATQNAWSFLVTWLKNSGWELLGEIPVGGSLVRGLRETLGETNQEIQTLHNDIHAEMKKEVSSGFPKLENPGFLQNNELFLE